VLVLAPTSRDARITEALLDKAGLACVVCENLRDVAERIRLGAEAALLTEEAIVSEGIDELLRVLAEQPAWLDFPIVLLVRQFLAPSASRVLDSLSNVTILERPSPMRSLVSAVQAAIRSRQRQYQLQAALMQNEESLSLLNTLVGNAPVGIACLDTEMRYRLVNRPIADMNGLPIEAHLGRTLAEVVPDLVAQAEPLFREALAGRAVVDHHIAGQMPKAPGEERHWLESWYPIKTPDDRMLGVGVIVQEITERKRAEHEKQFLLESERAARSAAERANRLKDDFLATLSHELRTPLNGILGWAQLLQRSQSRSEADLMRGLEAIARNAKAQAELIDDLLDMGRIISGKLRLDIQTIMPAAVVETAIDTVRPAAEARGIRLEQILDPGAGPIKGDPNRLQQVVWNLLTNAVKFTPRGGKVQVILERVNSQIEITVSDTG
jgi:PAS domain S-box-containing protein